MFTITRISDNRVDYAVTGKIDKEQMSDGLDEFVAKSEGVEHGKMLCRIENFELPTLGAIAVEFARLPKLFKLIGRFDKAALLADKNWIKKAGEIEGALIPGLEIKAFNLDEQEAAEAWLDTD